MITPDYKQLVERAKASGLITMRPVPQRPKPVPPVRKEQGNRQWWQLREHTIRTRRGKLVQKRIKTFVSCGKRRARRYRRNIKP